MRFLLPRKRNEKERQNQQNITKVENNATRTDKILRNEIRERECDCAGSAFRMIMQNERRKKKETAIRLGAPQLAYFFFIAHTHTRTQKCLAASFLLAELFISFSLPTAQLPLPPKKKKKEIRARCFACKLLRSGFPLFLSLEKARGSAGRKKKKRRIQTVLCSVVCVCVCVCARLKTLMLHRTTPDTTSMNEKKKKRSVQ